MQRVLTSLLDAEVAVGLSFDQQIKGDASVPDALIVQEPLRIFIETKRGDAIDADQIRRHFDSIKKLTTRSGDGDWLISLTKEPIAESARTSLGSEAQANGINFVAVTFSQIVEAVRAVCLDWERELLSVVDDYESYLNEEGLLEERNQYLVVFPCGTSLPDNARLNLYYEPASRACKRNYRYIGVYSKKVIAYVGTVQAIVVASWTDGSLSVVEEVGHLTEDHRKRIAAAIEETHYYDLKAGPNRYYLVDAFMPTEARKSSSGGLMGLRYLELPKVISDFDPRKTYSTENLANLLRQTTWE